MARREAHAFNSAPGRQWQVDLYEIQDFQGYGGRRERKCAREGLPFRIRVCLEDCQLYLACRKDLQGCHQWSCGTK